jgi:hypothetical protein
MSVARARQPSDAPSSWGNQPPHRSLSDRRKNPASSPMRIVYMRKRPSPQGAIGGACPKRLTMAIGDETASPQSLHEEAHALGVVPQGLDQITPPTAKDKEMPTMWVTPQYFLDLQSKAVHTASHVGVAGRQPHPHPARERDHRPTSTRSAVAIVLGSTTPEIRTRSPCGSSISIDPEEVAVPGGTASALGAGKAAGGAIVTAAKPNTAAVGAGRSASARSCLRQVKSWLVLTPYRRATPCTVPPAANVSATRRCLSSSDQRRRACPRKISTCAIRSPQGLVQRPLVRPVGAAILPILGARTRRPSPEAYAAAASL